jgi:hypothetical protein
VGILAYGPPGGWERWSDLENLSRSSNVQVRVETSKISAALAIKNPLGKGISYKEVLRERSDVSSEATHNAVFQLALLGGLPIAIYVVYKLGYAAIRLLQQSRLEGWVSLHLLGLFCFEEYFSNMTIMVIVAWLLLRSFKR